MADVDLRKFNGIVLYADENEYSKRPLIKECFDSIKKTFYDVDFVKLPFEYIDKARELSNFDEMCHLTLFGKVLYICDHPDLNIAAVELDIYVIDVMGLRQEVFNIWSKQRESHYLDDCFIIRQAGESVAPLKCALECCYNSVDSYKKGGRMRDIHEYFLKKRDTQLDYKGYFNHFGEIAFQAKVHNLQLRVSKELKSPEKYYYIVPSLTKTGRYHYDFNLCYCYMHPIMVAKYIKYVNQQNPGLVKM